MTFSWRGLDALGDTHATVSGTMGCHPARGSYPQTRSWFGSQSATRLREAAVASNRGSAHRGEYVLGPHTTCPARPGRSCCSKTVTQRPRVFPGARGKPSRVAADHRDDAVAR